jgi:hypothetical protein
MSVYCNDCFTLAGIVVDRVSGQPIQDYVAAHIFAPLGMTHSIMPTTMPAPGTVAPVIIDGQLMPQEITNILASGGIMSTPTDMGYLAAMIMNGGVYAGQRIVSASAIHQMSVPQFEANESLTVTDPDPFMYGLGWDTVQEPGLRAVNIVGWSKGGDTTDYHAAFSLAPDQKLAAVVQATGRSIGSGMLETLAQRMLLQALVEKGDLAEMPSPVPQDGPKATTPNAMKVRAITGFFLSQGAVAKIESERGGLQAYVLTKDATWQPVPDFYTFRTDGRWWSTTTPGKSLTSMRAWGRSYLVQSDIAGNGHYLSDGVNAQKVLPGKALSAAWQARMSKKWLVANETPASALWSKPTVSVQAIPGLPGYAQVLGDAVTTPISTGTSESVGTMPIVLPNMWGRDLNDVVFSSHDGQDWMQVGTSIMQPKDGIAALSPGPNSVVFGSDGLVQWRSIANALAVTTSGASDWKVFDKDLLPIASGIGDATAAGVPAGGYLALFAPKGTTVSVTLG